MGCTIQQNREGNSTDTGLFCFSKKPGFLNCIAIVLLIGFQFALIVIGNKRVSFRNIICAMIHNFNFTAFLCT